MGREEFLLEDFKQARKEVAARERAIGQFFVVTVVTSISLLSALAAIYFGVEAEHQSRFSEIFAYAFLSPVAVILAMYPILTAHRRDIHRSATYIEVYVENQCAGGPMWESRVNEYRPRKKGESLDFVPKAFWWLFLLSVVAFLMVFIQLESSAFVHNWIVAVMVILGFTGAQFYESKQFSHASVNFRNDCLIEWRRIEEGVSKPEP